MARTPNVKIVSWGTPPEPEPTGWDAVAAELKRKPGSWANVGEMSGATARKISAERLPETDGYEVRAIAQDAGKVAVWVRYVKPGKDVETREDATPPAQTVNLDAPAKPRTVKRGGVV